eukprot:1653826-Rhodomonas_salina.1
MRFASSTPVRSVWAAPLPGNVTTTPKTAHHTNPKRLPAQLCISCPFGAGWRDFAWMGARETLGDVPGHSGSE